MIIRSGGFTPPENVRVTRRATGLPHESVVNVSQLITLDKERLTEKVGRLPADSLRYVEGDKAGARAVGLTWAKPLSHNPRA